ncbi:MAG: hypothetical protein K0R48_816, partial [Gammaproteobacteria bacterium]|nr:hypothetical protein [Gammaproteobacteria bacterium]
MVCKNLEFKNIFHLSAIAGVFIGANLGFNWLGKSIVNMTCSLAAIRCAYSFWNVPEPGNFMEDV